MAISGEKAVRRFARAGFAQLVDDRARPVSPVSIAEFVRGGSNEHEAAARKSLGAWITAVGPGRWYLAFLSGRSLTTLIFAAAIYLILLSVGIKMTLGWGVALLPPGVVFALIMLKSRAGTRIVPLHPPSAAAHGFCGACGYSLRELPLQSDGCIVCAECGAAWRHERLTMGWWQPRPHVACSRENRRGLGERVARDSSGVLVPVLTLYGVREQQYAPGRTGNDGWLASTRELTRVNLIPRAAMAIVTMAMLSGAGWLYSAEDVISYRPRPALMAAMIIIGVLVSIFVLLSDLFITSSDVLALLTLHERCPSCAHRLTRVVNEEHVVVCTHCGSTWLLPAKNETAM